MKRNKLQNYAITQLHSPQRGYILITLMLAIALIAIAMLAVLPRVKQRIQRDQEEELCHRGTAYMRAIQHFYKRFGRYPTRLEELEDTNNIRFLRRRYKDPITGKDFKILHLQDVALNSGPLLGPAIQQGAPGVKLPPNQLGGIQGTSLQMAAPLQVAAQGNDNSDTGGSGNSQANSGSSSSSSSSSSASSSTDSGSSSSNTGSGSGAFGSGQVFGGGPILGVASTSKATTIREFDKKNHYKDWLFIYDPTSDRGGLLIGPWQTGLTGGLGGSGLGTPVQNISQPPQGTGVGVPQPLAGQPQGLQRTPQNQPQNPGDNSPDQ